jgi:hypothetical protein
MFKNTCPGGHDALSFAFQMSPGQVGQQGLQITTPREHDGRQTYNLETLRKGLHTQTLTVGRSPVQNR